MRDWKKRLAKEKLQMQVSVEEIAENSETVEKKLFASHELQEASPPKLQETLSSAIASTDAPVLTFSVLSCLDSRSCSKINLRCDSES